MKIRITPAQWGYIHGHIEQTLSEMGVTPPPRRPDGVVEMELSQLQIDAFQRRGSAHRLEILPDDPPPAPAPPAPPTFEEAFAQAITTPELPIPEALRPNHGAFKPAPGVFETPVISEAEKRAYPPAYQPGNTGGSTR